MAGTFEYIAVFMPMWKSLAGSSLLGLFYITNEHQMDSSRCLPDTNGLVVVSVTASMTIASSPSWVSRKFVVIKNLSVCESIELVPVTESTGITGTVDCVVSFLSQAISTPEKG